MRVGDNGVKDRYNSQYTRLEGLWLGKVELRGVEKKIFFRALWPADMWGKN
jgi:hypothetical protein